MNETIEKLVGFYQFVSPYHEDKRLLPFHIIGPSYVKGYPIKVETVEYRGYSKKKVISNYTIDKIKKDIDTGILVLVPPCQLNPLFIDQIASFSHLISTDLMSKTDFLKVLKETYCVANPKTELFYLAANKSDFNSIRLCREKNQLLFNY